MFQKSAIAASWDILFPLPLRMRYSGIQAQQSGRLASESDKWQKDPLSESVAWITDEALGRITGTRSKHNDTTPGYSFVSDNLSP